jgi:hypothetical protein
MISSIQDIQIKKVSLRHTRVNGIMCLNSNMVIGGVFLPPASKIE